MLDPWVLPVLPLVGRSLCELVARVAGACGSPSTSPTASDFVLYIPPSRFEVLGTEELAPGSLRNLTSDLSTAIRKV